MLKQIVFFTLLIVFVLLQMQLWGQDGTRATLVRQNQQELEMLERITLQEERTQALADDIHYLRENPEAIEARARHDLGMIKPDENLIFLPTTEP